MQFFKDDFATGQGEASAGEVDRIMVWDGALTAGEVADFDMTLEGSSPVPEPGTLSLGGLALAAAAVLRRFRK